MKQIKYIKKKTKYQLSNQYIEKTGIIGYDISTNLLRLTPVGVLIIDPPYPWDGPSGPTIDTPDSMRGSLEHDAFYEFMRKGLLPISEKDAIDQRLEDVCLEDGMNPVRAEIWRTGVDLFGSESADPENNPKIRTAP